MLVYGDLIAAGLEELSADPTTSLFSGRMYRNTTTGEVKVYTGSSWKTVVDLDTAQQLTGKTVQDSVATDVDVRFPTAGSSSKELQVPRLTTPERNALVSPTTGRVVFDTTLGSMFVYNGSAWTPAGGGATLKSTITKAGHGFTANDLGCPLYLNGSDYAKAKADSSTMAEVVGLLDSIIDSNTFTLAMAGEVTVALQVSDFALVPGETYFLSDTTAGKIVSAEPTVVGTVSKPLGVAKTSTVLEFINMRGSVVGGANARTQISLANAATSTVQNVSAYEAGELTGWVSIQATTPLKFYIASQFSKNGSGNNYNISTQTSGDTPPIGFSVSITAAGLIQITLPSVAGFGSANINYALNAPAVGVTLPLSIQATQVIGDTNPVGTLLDYAGSTAPSGYLMCDGRSLSTAGTYAALFAVIGYAYGGSGASFNIPDFRGRFARYEDNMGTVRGAANLDKGTRNSDKTQNQSTAKNGLSIEATNTDHDHFARQISGPTLNPNSGIGNTAWCAVAAVTNDVRTSTANSNTIHTHSITGDLETRPVNISCYKIIKY
jgi:microcystin-dependent protein